MGITRIIVPEGAQGELLLSGPSLFEKYGNSDQDPFVEVQTAQGMKRFYRTEDLVREGPKHANFTGLDGKLKGHITILGRVGEMVKRNGVKVFPPQI